MIRSWGKQMQVLQNHFVAMVMLILFIGCQQENNPSSLGGVAAERSGREPSEPRVGIVDMQRLSIALGISEQLTAKRRKLQEDWDKINTETRDALEKKLEGLGGDLQNITEEGKRELQKLEMARRQRLSAADRDNTTALQETNRWLRRVLREKTRGPIEAIGVEKGFDLILVQSPGEVAYIRPGVDVTDLVLKRAGGIKDESKQDEAKSRAGDVSGE
jgi:Skp family chaperone for outer membrane proteins